MDNENFYSKILSELHHNPVINIISDFCDDSIAEVIAAEVEKQGGNKVLYAKNTSLSAMLSHSKIKDKHKNGAVSHNIPESSISDKDSILVCTTCLQIMNNIGFSCDVIVIDSSRNTNTDLLLYTWKSKYDSGCVVPRLVIISPMGSIIDIGATIRIPSSKKKIIYPEFSQSLSETIKSYHYENSQNDPRPSGKNNKDIWVVFLPDSKEITQLYKEIKDLESEVEIIRMYDTDIMKNLALGKFQTKRRIILCDDSSLSLDASIIFDSMLAKHNNKIVKVSKEESMVRSRCANVIFRNCKKEVFEKLLVCSRGGSLSKSEISSTILSLSLKSVPYLGFFKMIGTNHHEVKEVKSQLDMLKLTEGDKLSEKGKFSVQSPVEPCISSILFSWLNGKSPNNISIYSVCSLAVCMTHNTRDSLISLEENLNNYLDIVRTIGSKDLSAKIPELSIICKKSSYNIKDILAISEKINNCVDYITKKGFSNKQESIAETNLIIKTFRKLIKVNMSWSHGYVRARGFNKRIFVSKSDGFNLKINSDADLDEIIVTKHKLMKTQKGTIIRQAQIYLN